MAADLFASSPDVDLRKKWALMQLQGASDASPVRHPLQAVARAMQGAMGGYMGYQAEQENKANQDKLFDAYLGPQGGTAPAAVPQPAPQAPLPAQPGGTLVSDTPSSPYYQKAIAGIESGGDYGKLGPVIEKGRMAGDRAYGKYQVMGANVGPWTQEVLGRRMTPQEFAQDKLAQDQVFNAKFGQYAQKYGPEGAARAWFAGEGGMNNPNAKDQLGTTVSAYADKFNAGMQPYHVAALGNGVPAAPQIPPAGQQVAQAAPMRAPTPIPQSEMDRVARLRAVGTKEANALALQILQQYAKPIEPKFNKLDDETLYDERTGATKSAGPGYKSLVDPAERAKYGIPADDKRPYQVRGGKLINPPAETRLNIDQRAESAFDTKAAGLQADRFNDIVKAGFEAKAKRADFTALRDIGTRLNTGKTAEVIAALGPWAEAAGIKIDGLSDIQAYKSIVAKMAPRMRPVGSGSSSDFDVRQYLESLPTLGKTPQGNAIIDATFSAMQDHEERAAEIASRAMNKEITPREADKMLRELPDPLEAWKKNKGIAKLGENVPPPPPGFTVK